MHYLMLTTTLQITSCHEPEQIKNLLEGRGYFVFLPHSHSLSQLVLDCAKRYWSLRQNFPISAIHTKEGETQIMLVGFYFSLN